MHGTRIPALRHRHAAASLSRNRPQPQSVVRHADAPIVLIAHGHQQLTQHYPLSHERVAPVATRNHPGLGRVRTGRLFDAEQLLARPDDRRPPRRYTHRADRGPHSPRHAGTKSFTARRCAAQTSPVPREPRHPQQRSHGLPTIRTQALRRSTRCSATWADAPAALPTRGAKAFALRPAGSPVARPAIPEPGGRRPSPAPPAKSSSRSPALQPLAGPRCDGRQQPARTSKRKAAVSRPRADCG